MGKSLFRFLSELLKRQKTHSRTFAISGFGMCSQRAGAEIGAAPDLYTACKVVNSHPDTACQFAKPVWVGPACQVPNHTGMHCLRSSERTAMPCLSSCNASVVRPTNNVMPVQVLLGVIKLKSKSEV